MKRLSGPLQVLVYLHGVNEPVTLSKISWEAKMNYRTIHNAIKLLKELNFIKEKTRSQPPPRYIIRLTEKGQEATVHAHRILESEGSI